MVSCTRCTHAFPVYIRIMTNFPCSLIFHSICDQLLCEIKIMPSLTLKTNEAFQVTKTSYSNLFCAPKIEGKKSKFDKNFIQVKSLSASALLSIQGFYFRYVQLWPLIKKVLCLFQKIKSMKIGILTIVLIIPINNFDKKYVCVIFYQWVF